MSLEYGQAYCHETMVYQIGGVALLSLKSVRWKKSRGKHLNYGTGADAISYGTSHKKDVELSFVVSKHDLVRLQDGQPDRDITNILPFDIPVVNDLIASPRLDTIENVMIQDYEEVSEEGSGDIPVTITAIATDVVPKGM